MRTNGKTAIIIGATGLAGSILLKLLLENNAYEKIKLFSRSSVGYTHSKLEEHIVNLFKLEDWKSDFVADEVYCCIGTTKKKTPNKEEYEAIDYGIPVRAAKLAKENGIETILIISALGANAKSVLFYNRIKGEMENEILKLQIEKTHILQPSLIGGKRNEKRSGEWLFKQIMKVLNLGFVGPLEKYRSIDPIDIAKAMIWLANNSYEGVKIESDKIKKIVH
tara:strand:+ start:8622 stop:9287 length:666 start_codon:yes stop_codon:yes gene_type:complete